MAMFGYRRFNFLFAWLRKKALFFWRFFAPGLHLIVGYSRKVLTWRKSSRGPQDDGPERTAERDFEAAAGGREVGPKGWETDPGEQSMYE